MPELSRIALRFIRATGPFGWCAVARMQAQRAGIRGEWCQTFPDCAALHPGYGTVWVVRRSPDAGPEGRNPGRAVPELSRIALRFIRATGLSGGSGFGRLLGDAFNKACYL